MIISEENYLAHYGTLRKSGRYPWGSGGERSASNLDFLGQVEKLRGQGLSEVDIARGFGLTSRQLRNYKTIAKAEKKQDEISQAVKLRDKGVGVTQIGVMMGKNESTVRALLKDSETDKANILANTSEVLRSAVADKKYIDVGSGVENHLGISREKLGTAVALLKDEGYTVHYVKVRQVGTGLDTSVKVLAPPGVGYAEMFKDREKIQQVPSFSEDGGRSFLGLKPPLQVSSKRVNVVYAEEGGSKADGVIYVRPGVPDTSLGGSRYAQVRIGVDGTHYLKGMAMYSDKLPPGVDLEFHTNKSNTGNKKDAMKPVKDDPDNPFGAIVRQRIDPKTGRVTSVMNIVGTKEGSGEEGGWDMWSKSLSSQMLSKQSPALAKTQLEMTYEKKRDALDEIMSLTNPVVQRKLLIAFADGADSSAVHLKAAEIPRQSTHVILPINSLKKHEIYAPNFKAGETVVLIRYPHGGIFEIPELTVNNNNREAKKALGSAAADAIGIHHSVASRLSGADFDGDTVLVIPNNNGRIKTQPALKGLVGFDGQKLYKGYEGMPKMADKTLAKEMGAVSNLITDMTIRRASSEDLARAVRHSMVVIDAQKHNLDYKRSAVDNGINQLKAKYQVPRGKGASTLISRATSSVSVPERKQGYTIDKKTGAKIYQETGRNYVDKQGKVQYNKTPSTQLAEAKDAHTLSSGTRIESVYADHSNRLKALANTARKTALSTKPLKYDPNARKVYSEEVKSLDLKLDAAFKNKPRERAAQILANTTISAKRRADPTMDKADIKKLSFQALAEARTRTGAGKQRITLTDKEWEAIQSGAIRTNKLTNILDNADLDQIKALATPRVTVLMTSTKTARAQSMSSSGYTQSQIADALGVSLTTLKTTLKG